MDGEDKPAALLLATGAFMVLYGVVSAPMLWHEPAGAPMLLASAILAAGLAALSAVDLYQFRLPDLLTLPLLAIGLMVALGLGEDGAVLWHAVSAGIGFALLAGVAFLYKKVRGHPGLGLGDAKLLAASGAWLGAEALPTVLLWACGSALIGILIAAWRSGKLSARSRIPFGPFLAFGTWLVWVYGFE
jgi:leader peptidase (prepilin peptidase)/N-methyltransferase